MNNEIAKLAVKPQLLPLGVSGVDEFLAMFTPSGDTENPISVDEPNIHSSQSLHPYYRERQERLNTESH